MVSWNENDALFKKLLLEGREWEVKVAKKIRSWGLDVELGALSVREHITEAHKYADQTDLTSYGYTLEVKSRDLFFTYPENFPYRDVFVDTVSGFASKTPDMVLCVSQKTGKVIALPVAATREHWIEDKRRDGVRGIVERFFVCDQRYWKDEEWLRWALERAASRPRRRVPRRQQV